MIVIIDGFYNEEHIHFYFPNLEVTYLCYQYLCHIDLQYH